MNFEANCCALEGTVLSRAAKMNANIGSKARLVAPDQSKTGNSLATTDCNLMIPPHQNIWFLRTPLEMVHYFTLSQLYFMCQ